MYQENCIKNIITKALPKQLTKPPFLKLIEKHFAQSRINQHYKFPRTEDIEEDQDEMQCYGVYDLHEQNKKKLKITKQLNTIDLDNSFKKKRNLSQKSNCINLSLNIQRIKTEQDDPSIKLPTLKVKPKTKILQLRSISQTVCQN